MTIFVESSKIINKKFLELVSDDIITELLRNELELLKDDKFMKNDMKKEDRPSKGKKYNNYKAPKAEAKEEVKAEAKEEAKAE